MMIQNVMRKMSVVMAFGAMTSVHATELTEAEKAQGWKSLFDGKSFAGWRSYKHKEVKSGWLILDGTMVHTKGGGDLITKKQYEDYELSLEWKVSEKGNSGILLAAQETDGPIYKTAIEMQILDDKKHQPPISSSHDALDHLTQKANS